MSSVSPSATMARFSRVASETRSATVPIAASFHIDRMSATGSIYTLGYLVERLRKTVLGKKRAAPARWPGSGLRIPFNLFDVVTVWATRVGEPP